MSWRSVGLMFRSVGRVMNPFSESANARKERLTAEAKRWQAFACQLDEEDKKLNAHGITEGALAISAVAIVARKIAISILDESQGGESAYDTTQRKKTT